MARNPNGKGGGSEKGEHTRYKKEYCEMLVKHMAQGYSFTSFGADIGTCGKTLYIWCEKHPEFEKARRIGHDAAKKYFETIAHAKMRGQDLYNKKGEKIFDAKKADTAIIIFFLKTRFRDEYSEKYLLNFENETVKPFKIEYSNGNVEVLSVSKEKPQ